MKIYTSLILIYISFIFAACWESDPHRRPDFPKVLEALDDIARSAFANTPHESFHSMQDDWRREIEEVLLELRRKEKVHKH